MTNRRRGEVALDLGDARFTLCLTLGALAELESACGASDLGALAERFGTGRLSSADLLAVLGAGLRGGGHALDAAAIAALPLPDGLGPVVRAVAELLVAAFGAAPANPPAPQGG
ncbi:MAG TPA: gene transfer agent family protein [Microvirga sp.]|jgi:hypothetical protein|nr:gene transfer agent family protein [Microvirga sp.]